MPTKQIVCGFSVEESFHKISQLGFNAFETVYWFGWCNSLCSSFSVKVLLLLVWFSVHLSCVHAMRFATRGTGTNDPLFSHQQF